MKATRRSLITNIGELIGLGLLVYGVFQLSVPGGWIVLGFGMMFFSALADRPLNSQTPPGAEPPRTTMVNPETGETVESTELGGINPDRSIS